MPAFARSYTFWVTLSVGIAIGAAGAVLTGIQRAAVLSPPNWAAVGPTIQPFVVVGAFLVALSQFRAFLRIERNKNTMHFLANFNHNVLPIHQHVLSLAPINKVGNMLRDWRLDLNGPTDSEERQERRRVVTQAGILVQFILDAGRQYELNMVNRQLLLDSIDSHVLLMQIAVEPLARIAMEGQAMEIALRDRFIAICLTNCRRRGSDPYGIFELAERSVLGEPPPARANAFDAGVSATPP